MTKLSLACSLALSVALAACSSAPPAASNANDTPATNAATPAKASSKPKLACGDDTDQMGSHFAHPICLSPEQVEQREKDAQSKPPV